MTARSLQVEPPSEPFAHWTPRQTHQAVWRIAWPSVLTFALMTTNSILDRMFVGRLGRDALAAVGVGGQIMFVTVSMGMAITVGTTALVARFTGAQDPDQAERSAGQSIGLAGLVGLASMALILISMDPLLRLMGVEGSAARQCRAFLFFALLGMTPGNMGAAISAVFRGLGDTRSPLKVMLAANAIHILGDWTLMLGNWGAPRLGLRGGGIALSASTFFSLLLYLVLLRRSPVRGCLAWRHLAPTFAWAWRILRIGIPAAIAAVVRSTAMLGFTSVLSRTAEGINAVAALPIGLTAESIAFMPGLGFSVAASALVGQALGARSPGHAERLGWAATHQGLVIMTLMGAVFFIFAEPFARLFTSDPKVLPIAVNYLRIMAISEPMLAYAMILTGGLQGAGDTIRPTVATAISFWVVRLPLAWLLALHLRMGANGAWIAMSATTVLSGFFAIILFRDGKWKKARV